MPLKLLKYTILMKLLILNKKKKRHKLLKIEKLFCILNAPATIWVENNII